MTSTVGSLHSRLIMIRGNSGSGKSAVAAVIRASRPHGTVAVVGQDVIRRTVLGIHDDARLSAVGLVDLATRYARAKASMWSWRASSTPRGTANHPTASRRTTRA